MRDIFYIAENKYIDFEIAYNNSKDEYYIYAKCCKCNNEFRDNNMGRLKFNIKVHFSIRHGVDL
jgi:hypothetical protein